MAKLFREDAPRTLFTKRRVIFGAVLLVAILVFMGAYFLISKTITQQANVAFTIDSKSYSKTEVTALVQYRIQRGTDKETAAKDAFEYLKRQVAAKKAGIAIADDKITEARDYLFPGFKDVIDADGVPWVTLASYNEALTRELTGGKLSDASGYVFVFPFDNLIARDYISSFEQPRGYGDATLIASDKAYAKERADHYVDALKENTLTSDAALAEVKADARLGQLGLPNTNTSAKFVGFVSGDPTRPEVYIGTEAKAEVLSVAGKKGIGSVKVGTSASSKTESVDSYYYFVVIDKPSSVSSKTGFESALKKLSSSYKGLK